MRRSTIFFFGIFFLITLGAFVYLKLFHKKYHRFVITIPSYNNSQWYRYNLSSVFSQDYPYYRVIYIDDASTDNTYELVRKFISQHNLQHRITLLRNKKNHGALYNLYRMIHMCDDDEIIVNLDGDDWLAHKHALSKLNDVYQDPNIWLTYSRFQIWPTHILSAHHHVPPAVIQKNEFREFTRSIGFYFAQLRTYHAYFAKKIKLCDLISPIGKYRGYFYSAAADKVLMFPLLELAGKHFTFIPDVLLRYNIASPLNEHKMHGNEQKACGDFLHWQKKYQPFQSGAKYKHAKKINRVDIIIFSYDRPIQLYALLESIEKHLRGIGSIITLYRSSTERFEEAYDKVKSAFPNTIFMQQKRPGDFYPLTLQAINHCKEKYLMFAVDDDIVIENTDLITCTKMLRQTKAFGFFLRLGSNVTWGYMTNHANRVPPLQKICRQIRCYKPFFGSGDWTCTFSHDMTIYKKKFLMHLLNFVKPFNAPWPFEWDTWHCMPMLKESHDNVALCFKRSKIIGNAVNKVHETQTGVTNYRCAHFYTKSHLLNIFNNGYKIDITQFENQKFNACHIAVPYKFIKRIY